MPKQEQQQKLPEAETPNPQNVAKRFWDLAGFRGWAVETAVHTQGVEGKTLISSVKYVPHGHHGFTER